MGNLRRFVSYYKEERRLFIMDMICASLIAGMDLVFPMITREFMRDYIPNQNMRAVAFWIVALIAMYLARLGCQYFRLLCATSWCQYGIPHAADLKHLQTLDFKFFDDNKVGHLMSRLVNDLRDVVELVHHGPERSLHCFCHAHRFIFYLLRINVPLTLISFAFIPIIGWFA